MTAAAVPVTVAEDAAAQVAQWGMQRELDQMIEHARQTAPGLRSIRVTLEYNPARPEEEPGVVIWVLRDDLAHPEVSDPTDWDWCGWRARTFPPEVLIHFSMISLYGDMDGW
jgi:hypothetical protein